MKQDQKCKIRRRVWHTIGGFAFVTGMCMIMPKLIKKGSDYLYSKNHPSVKLQDDDWGPEIVKKNTLGDKEDGTI